MASLAETIVCQSFASSGGGVILLIWSNAADIACGSLILPALVSWAPRSFIELQKLPPAEPPPSLPQAAAPNTRAAASAVPARAGRRRGREVGEGNDIGGSLRGVGDCHRQGTTAHPRGASGGTPGARPDGQGSSPGTLPSS